MMKIFLCYLLILFSFMMLFLNHPLSMGLMILIQTILLCLILGFFMKTYWFSYILFLTFLGGLLVLFIYVSSVASNEMFKVSYFLNFFIFLMIVFGIFSMYFYNKLNFLNFYFNFEMMEFFYNFYFFNNENKINLSKLYNSHTYLLMLMLIIYLFITLIAVVKITNIFFGTLRTSN